MVSHHSEVTQPSQENITLIIAHDTANNSSSIIAYLVSGSDKKREPACTNTHVSSNFCWGTKPSPCRLASVQIRVGLLGSKKERIGATRDDLTPPKTSSSPGDHTKSFFVLRRGRRGFNRPAMAGILAER